MKCPKCHRNMTRKQAPGNIYYFECDHCGTSIGKPDFVQAPKVEEEERVIHTADDDDE